MKFLKILIFIFSLYSLFGFSNAYICNFDYYEKLSYNHQEASTRTTAIFNLQDCTKNKEVSYRETIGNFKIYISCKESIAIKIYDTKHAHEDLIMPEEFEKKFSRSFLNNRSGLKIYCQQRSLAGTTTGDIN